MWKLLAVSLAVLAFSKSEAQKVTVGIVHYNDVYGQLFPFKKNSDPLEMCSDNDVDCIGGVRELAGHIKDITTNFESIDAKFVIATGNLISGDNGWLTYLNEESSWSEHGNLLRNRAIDFSAINYYKPNFMALGPKEFEGGVSILNTYLGYGTSTGYTRVIVSNLNCDNVKVKDEQRFCDLVDPFQIVTVGNLTIGLIGFVDPKVVHIADPGTLQFENTINSLKSVVETYLADVNVVIAIGSGSLELVQSIANEIERVQVVIYSNDKDEDQGTYPLHYYGKYIAKAGMYGSSVGKLVLDFETTTGKISLNDLSKLVEVDNSTIPDDYLPQYKFDEFKRAIKDEYYNKKISRAKVTIDGTKENCWTDECTLGNLVADSMVHCVFQNTTLTTPADLIAVWHSGGLGNVQIPSGDNITLVDAHKLLPYSSKATLVTITGKTLKKMFIQSSTALDDSPPFQWGQFLQVSSGIQVHYTIENGETVVSSLKTVKMMNDQLKYVPVDDASIYYVVIPSPLYNGHNAYWDLPGSFISGGGYDDHTFIGTAHTCLKNYLQKMGAMKFGVDKRIFIN